MGIIRNASIAADAKSEHEISILHLAPLDYLVNYFVITSGENNRQVEALVSDIEKQIKEEMGIYPSSIEGRREGAWVLLDYGDVVVHVFNQKSREYYDLEHLWPNAPRLEFHFN